MEITAAEADAAVESIEAHTPFELPGQNPKTGEGLLSHVISEEPGGRISYSHEMTFKGITGAGGKPVEVRRQSADMGAPPSSYSHSNPTTVVNTVKEASSGLPKLSPGGYTIKDKYLAPFGSFININKGTPATQNAKKESVHYR
ncbi:hypothetical protein [Frankia gtarii]|uniref:hypothetical protein n=1 Tax=Frankia gtarii TaxID=2950102 RepID=UPI0021C18997|nr:hypothetical protein [Frankia gtarii]